MNYFEITIDTTPEAVEILGDTLTALGYGDFLVEDEADFRTFLEENRQYWDYVDDTLERSMAGVSRIRFYLPADAQAKDNIAALRAEMTAFRKRNPETDCGSLEINVKSVQNSDWENNWKKYYQPILIGKKLLIVPSWLDPPIPEGRNAVRLDPGLIFGTGAHASTQLCLTVLETIIRGREHLLDLGGGSGILSIAALLLGAEDALSLDIDPLAEDIARENAALNGLASPRFTAATADVLSSTDALKKIHPEGWDIITANIVADVILPLTPAAASLLHKDGYFLCSGILSSRADEIARQLTASGFVLEEKGEKDDWCCFLAKKEAAV